MAAPASNSMAASADWQAVAEVKKAVRVPVIVNGDIIDAASAREALAQSGADAVMIGRGAYGRPWIAAALDNALRVTLRTSRSRALPHVWASRFNISQTRCASMATPWG